MQVRSFSNAGHYTYLFIYMVRTGGILFEGDPEPIMKELKRIGDQVKEVGEKALKEAEKAGELSQDARRRRSTNCWSSRVSCRLACRKRNRSSTSTPPALHRSS
jgi:hypothetical protein